MTFYEWLNTRKITDDPQGDLLADMRRDPAVKTVETWQRLTQVIPGGLHEYAWPLWVAYRAKKFGERLPEVPPVPERQEVGVYFEEEV